MSRPAPAIDAREQLTLIVVIDPKQLVELCDPGRLEVGPPDLIEQSLSDSALRVAQDATGPAI
jgi:hypothetical protein